MSHKHERCQAMVDEWVSWLDTKRFLAPPPAKNILELLQKRRGPVKLPPDGQMSAEICAFNLAVVAQPNHMLIPFLCVYAKAGDKPNKCYAADLGIDRTVFYDRAHKAASDIYKHHLALIDLNRMMQREVEGFAA